jgi:hypothetical protein
MIKKLQRSDLWGDTADTLSKVYRKQCEIVDHLNTQEEKANERCKCKLCQPELYYATASNQSNTEDKADVYSFIESQSFRENQKLNPIDYLVKKIKEIELPQKIKLLKDRAGYPAGEYELAHLEGMYGFWERDMYVPTFKYSNSNSHIHPDIIKATSWQGIRSEVTDGEDRLSRRIEKKKWSLADWTPTEYIDKRFDFSTPQTEPIESPIETSQLIRWDILTVYIEAWLSFDKLPELEALLDELIEEVKVESSPPLESKYEERLKEKEMEGWLRWVPLETLPETLKQWEFMREMELEKRLESKYEE